MRQDYPKERRIPAWGTSPTPHPAGLHPLALDVTDEASMVAAVQAIQAAAGAPDQVAEVIMNAVQAEHPQTRYKVGAEAEQLTAMRRKLSDREWDALYRRLFDQGD